MTIAHRTTVRRYAGHLYALRFANDLTKVGRAHDARSRIGDHIREGRSHGNPVILQWVSIFIVELQKAERELIDWCAAYPGARLVRGHEWFMGLDYDEVIAQVDRIVRPRAVSEVSGRRLSEVGACGTLTDISKIVEPSPVVLVGPGAEPLLPPPPPPAPKSPPTPKPSPAPRLDRTIRIGAYARPFPERVAPDPAPPARLTFREASGAPPRA